jgi:formylglycine-generating enzyme required for sulfatase activity
MNPKEIEDLSSLSTEVAKEIVRLELSELRFASLASLSSRASAILSQTMASIELTCIKSLTVESAKALIPHAGLLTLPSIRELAPEVASMLAGHKGPLDLSGLDHISLEVAKEFSHYKGDLNLSGLSELSDDVARLLTLHEGVLRLNGISVLSDTSAEFLAKHSGPLHFDGIKILSSAASEIFGFHEYFLSLNGITRLTSENLSLLEHHKDIISLNGLSDIDTDHIEFLIKMRHEKIILDSKVLLILDRFNEAQAGKCESQLLLAHDYETGGILCKNIPMAQFWYAKAAEQGNDVARLKKCLLEGSGAIDLSDTMRISDEEAWLLAECDCNLILNGLKTISDNSASSLSQHKGVLSLDGVTSLSDSAIEFLSNHQGPISLGSLDLNDACARNALSKRNERLRMRRTGAPDGFVTISEGRFSMGGPEPMLNRILKQTSSHWPVHTVFVSKFYIAKYQVTKTLWNRVRDWGLDHGYTDLPYGNGKDEDHPVHSICWYDCVKWCNARSEMEWLNPCYSLDGCIFRTGLSSEKIESWRIDAYSEIICDWSADAYRLPSEAEWEKAARGGLIGKHFPNGDSLTHGDANFNADESDNFESKYHPTYNFGEWPFTSPVGSFDANGYGIYDIVGNVEEICWDLYYVEYYKDSPDRDPHGPSFSDMKRVSPSPMHGSRVTRGGSFCNTKYANNTYRKSFCDPISRHQSSGFRLARSV